MSKVDSRRRRGGLRLACVALGLTVMTTACGGGGTSSTGDAADSGKPAKTSMSVAAGAIAENIDPDAPSAVVVANYQTVKNVYEPLVRFGYQANDADLGGGLKLDTQKVEPALATSWEYADNAWTFKLREGVKSHAGNEFTSADVVWTYERSKALAATGALLWTKFMGVSAVEAVDKYTVKFTTDGASPMLLATMAVASYVRPIDSTEAKKHVTADDKWAAKWLGENAAGFGAYAISDWQRPRSITLQPRPDYWDAANSGNLAVTTQAVTNPAQRLNALTKGDVDIALGLTPQQVTTASQNDSLTVVKFNANTRAFVYPNLDDSNIADVKVRQAMWTAVPTKDIIERVYNGDAFELKSPVSPYIAGYTDEFFRYDHSMEKAKALMAESSKPNGFKSELYYSSEEPILQQVAEILKSSWAQIGIDIQLKAEPNAQLQTRNFNNHDIPLYMEDLGATEVPDACSIGALWAKGGIANSNNYHDDTFNKAFEDCLDQVEFADREPAMKQLQKAAIDNPMVIPIVGLYSTTVIRSNVQNLAFDPSGATPYRTVTVK
ncbi:ABC transporter substrate-binding protein [Nonomuraea cavernae]|uniref:ABC transporter substrate-binding protein n=1 Tax=Nonomuraea cavernae TaxID=2045107 RepID=UPI00340019BF